MKVLVLSLVTNIVVATPYKFAEAAVDAEMDGTATTETEEKEEEEDEVANHQEVSLLVSLCLLIRKIKKRKS